MPNHQLILASTSPYRAQLLDKLALPFVTISPKCDETPLQGETPIELVTRLARTKAESCRSDVPSLVIGSDQVCVIEGEIIGKPHTRENAIQQLTQQSGQAIQFFTGLAVFNSETEKTHVSVDTFTVHFRTLSRQQIEHYIDIEQPLYCAGSFKSEGLGIALFEKLEGKDPNALIGLPLIDLVTLLEAQGMHVL
ncbi:Maf family protein [Vibrio ostreicida]|uniref:7-methyl-GTP pyrophosphatase n=1 Tax=Vibrio ostreicida TaxID=526588 RepID=A0ABT8BVU9_9VIBR|nr:Maf family protein [Vibrio ostreicida]MDN3610514.1 Maf family protein [Vibrio ostreicida]NPD07484.1 septum formation inhibitor Maf [Vibrio ostreicida]